MALMAARGELPKPDCAIFADTGWEPRAVYEHLDRLEPSLPFPVYRVSAGNLRDHILQGTNVYGQKFQVVPWFTSEGMGRRQCTREFKLDPIKRKLRELLGYRPRQHIPPGSAEIWIGISTDEVMRMKPARHPWQTNRWPLIERGMSRRECAAWLRWFNWSAPKSACIGCPFHTDGQWRDLRDNDPTGWADAIAVDREIRRQKAQFMHHRRIPLEEVELGVDGPDLFLNECEGMCGV
jgi:hypothetical protein